MKALFLSIFLVPGFVFSLSAGDADSFETEVRPLLQKHCIECHGAKKQKGELRLDAKVFAFKGGDNGPAIIGGDPAKSALFTRIASQDPDERMPPKGEPLRPAQIAVVKSWIERGAVWPENEADRAAAVDKRMQHWSVQPVREDFPNDASIDGFIRAKLGEKGLSRRRQRMRPRSAVAFTSI